eukprot:5163881-Prymnesium_polylepis.3
MDGVIGGRTAVKTPGDPPVRHASDLRCEFTPFAKVGRVRKPHFGPNQVQGPGSRVRRFPDAKSQKTIRP